MSETTEASKTIQQNQDFSNLDLQAQLLQSRRYADQAQQQAVVMAQQHLQVGPNTVIIGLQSLHKFLCWL